ncbi:MAG: methionyl-tRNA formyltransferase [Candidatus Zambryskibacteria bacterium]|nr:methionyl-tRNA formyltransferase [Candidatus Zambryskibacteria bacterium]
MNILFFGTPEFAKDTLDTLEEKGIIPTCVVTAEDKPVGRKMVLTPPPAKVWAEARNIPVVQLKTLRTEKAFTELLAHGPFDVGIVSSYGKIIPKNILDLPKKGMLNIHPSLLPLHRGASPIQSTILSGDSFGVSIILLDEEMDHGPILAQEEIARDILPQDAYRDVAEKTLAKKGALMLVDVLQAWVENTQPTTEQNHTEATFCKKIQKSDGEVDLEKDTPQEIVHKVRAFAGWPGTFFFTLYNGIKIRVLITKADLKDGLLVLQSVKPEGKNEMSYEDFIRGNQSAK